MSRVCAVCIILCGMMLVATTFYLHCKLLLCQVNCTVYWLTSTGYGPRSRIVCVIGKSAIISEVVCLALFVCFKENCLMGYDCIRLYTRTTNTYSQAANVDGIRGLHSSIGAH
jgi:hypothetical protein